MCVSAGTDTRFSFSHGKDTTSVRGTYAPCALCALIGFTEKMHDQLHLPGRQTAVSGLVTRGLEGLVQLIQRVKNEILRVNNRGLLETADDAEGAEARRRKNKNLRSSAASVFVCVLNLSMSEVLLLITERIKNSF